MTLAIIFGATADGGTTVNQANWAVSRWQASSSKYATQMHVFSNASGNVKVQVYADSSSMPGTLLGYVQDAAITSGENIIQLSSPISITSGNYYWLGIVGDTTGNVRRTSTGVESYHYQSVTYSTFVPTSNPSGWDINSFKYALSLNVYGTDLPTITDIDTDEDIYYNQLGISLTGTELETTTNKLELCNNATYSSATIKTEQTISAWSNTSITFDAVKGSLTADANVYAFVTTHDGRKNSTGFTVYLRSPAFVNCAKINGVTNTYLSKINNIDISSISKINGITK